ncbi:MAG: hypothetical protein VX589_04985, partial [Myxococcota bacterium]|nr:hypothetical protein [Myxococcota bacterium]
DLELLIEAPIVLANEQTVRFAGNGGDRNGTTIGPQNSTIAPGKGAHLIDVPPNGRVAGLPERAGFGDMLFMIRYSPISQQRDEGRGTWTVELGYRAPTGTPMKAGDENVGRGVHELILASALSRQFRYVEPYVRFQFVKPFASQGSLFKNYGDQEEFEGPGQRVRFDMGAEFIPYSDTESGAKFFIDLGFAGQYQAKGRDYSELFDALGMAGQGCPTGFSQQAMNVDDRGLPNVACYNTDSGSEVRVTPTDGITTVDPYVTIQMKLGGGIYVSEHAKIGGYLSIAHDTEHFLSNASVGSDINNDQRVASRNQQGFDEAEHNPTYVPAIDRLGRRMRVEETTNFTFGLNLALML